MKPFVLLLRLLPSAQVGFFVAALVILVMGGSLFAATWKASAASRLATRSQEVLQTLGDVELNLARAESAQRGHLLSRDDTHLRERGAAMSKLREAIGALCRLTEDNPPQHAAAEQVEALLDRHMDPASRPGEYFSNAVYDITQRMERDEILLLDSRRNEELTRRALVRAVVVVAMLISLTVLGAGYAGFSRETRERMRAQRQLNDLAENLPVAVYQFRTGQAGGPRFEFVGGSALRLHGVTQEQALRDSSCVWNTIVHDDRPALTQAMKAAVTDLSPLDREYRVKGADGAVRWIRSSASLRREPDGSTLWNGCWADVTERKQLAIALEQAKHDADAASRAKSTFLATMSHEIRTPMNGVLAMLELLGLSRLDAEQRTTLSTVRESGRSLLRIIDDILDFSKIEAGGLALNAETASLQQVIERAFQIYSGMASSKGLLLLRHVDARISPALSFDPLRLSQILNNFISNALKFTHHGSVEISARRMAETAGRQTLCISVKDTGVGVAAEHQQQLFQPFVQAERGTARRYGGTGLGLAICKRLADSMEGSLQMQSAPGRGTTMSLTVSFPVADPRELPQAAEERREERLGSLLAVRRVAPSLETAEADGTLVLVVDDHPTNRMVLLRQVAALGYAAESAEDGAQALQMWQTGRFSLVLTDCNMPGMDGHELSRRIRALEAQQGCGRMPIVACTANALDGEAQACLDAGMDDYLVKPIELGELASRLDRWRPVPQTLPAPLDMLCDGTPAAQPPLDREALNAITGACADAERSILLDFRRVNDSDALMLRHAVGQVDAPLITRVSHRIKGASKMVGANRLAAVCESIEASSRAGDWRAITDEMASFQVEMQSLNAYLDAV